VVSEWNDEIESKVDEVVATFTDSYVAEVAADNNQD
jgi:hypothetical protein